VSLLAPSGRFGWLGWGTVVAVAYCGAASLGYSLGSVSMQSQATAVWPAIGIAVVAVYLGGLRMAWAIVLGGLAAGLLRGVPFAESVANGLVSTVNPLVVTLILRAFNFRPSLAQLRNVVVLIAACAVTTPLGAALGTATIQSLRDDSASAWVTWLTWWTGDTAGILLVAPILFEVVNRTVLRRERLVVSWPRASAVIGTASVVALAVFTPGGTDRLPRHPGSAVGRAGGSSTDRRDRQRRDRRHSEHRHPRRARTLRRLEPH
jgi:integral membrane sensor domain MASE1